MSSIEFLILQIKSLYMFIYSAYVSYSGESRMKFVAVVKGFNFVFPHFCYFLKVNVENNFLILLFLHLNLYISLPSHSCCNLAFSWSKVPQEIVCRVVPFHWPWIPWSRNCHPAQLLLTWSVFQITHSPATP